MGGKLSRNIAACKEGLLVSLTQGQKMMMSAVDSDIAVKHRFYAVKYLRADGSLYYRARTTMRGKKVWATRLIMNPPDDKYVDHINGDTLDNRRENLRVVDPSVNHLNRNRCVTSSGVLGVSVHCCGKFYGRVGIKGKTYCTKLCECKYEAERLLIDIKKDKGVYDDKNCIAKG